ncbi:MAG: HAD hydrolase-like protein [Nitrososphaerales archaeon]
MQKLFIFDLHNTLVSENDKVVVTAMNSLLAEKGLNVRVDIEYVRHYQARLKPFSSYFRDVMPSVPENVIEEMTLATKERCEKSLIAKYIKKMQDAEYVLSEIKKRSDLIYVLSFSMASSIDIYLTVTGLDKYVDKRIGIEGSQEIHGDGDPGEVKAWLIKKHLKNGEYSRIFMIGDSMSDMRAGKLIGATTIYFTGTREYLDMADYSIDRLIDIIKIAYNE